MTWVLLLASLGCMALTFSLGERNERIACVILFLDMIASPVIQNAMIGDFRWGVALVDGLTALALIGLALKGSRWWLLIAAGLQVAVLLTHLAVLGGGFVYNWTAVTVRILTWCALMLVVGLGAYETHIVTRHQLLPEKPG